ncbi:MAG: hypothetical protein VB055_07645 [Oscillospiraceae bacterium]|nr:hypothetical protein [Oscillospiraceae bacterium]
MNTNKVIDLRAYRQTPFDYAGYNGRAVRRYRRAAFRKILTTVLDALCAVTLIVCLLIGTSVLLRLG